MNNRISLIVAFCFIAAALFSACSEWTETESLTITEPGIEEQNPELYAQYLENLKNYKNTDHKAVYAWFDNRVKIPVTHAQHLSAIPDSVDIAVMMYPDELCDREISEMEAIRNDKGTKVIYTISYPEIENSYQATVEAELEAAEKAAAGNEEAVIESATQLAGFNVYLVSSMDKALQLADKYNYDGLAIRYDSKNLIYMEAAEKDQYAVNQSTFFSKVSEWVAAHLDKIIVFEGKPQYLIDKTLLSRCRYIVLRTLDATAAADLTFRVHMAIADGVPTDRFIVSVSTASLDPADSKTGYFIDDEGHSVSALPESARWVATPEFGFTKAGLGIYDIQNDYYNTSLVYKYTRRAVDIMNPSPKN